MRLTAGLLQMEDVLQTEGLDEPTLFAAADAFDEIPLYSRYVQLGFLRRESSSMRDDILLGAAGLLLQRLVSRLRGKGAFFAAVTVLEERPMHLLVPRVFVCRGRPRSRLASLKGMTRATSELSRRLAASLTRLGVRQRYSLRDDAITVPGHMRVFMGHATAAHPRMLLLTDLAKATR
jgi:hypothetical protein